MRLVIADTGPVNYLIQIGQIDLLPDCLKKLQYLLPFRPSFPTLLRRRRLNTG